MPTQNQIEIKKYITPSIKELMNSWEKKFITSIYTSSKPWTPKQVEVFNKIKIKYNLVERKIIENVIYVPEGYAEGARINQQITSKKFRRQRGINLNKGIKK
jgi:hypothetical protein